MNDRTRQQTAGFFRSSAFQRRALTPNTNPNRKETTMLVSTLRRLLKELPRDHEVRIAACVEIPDFEDRPSYDMPIAGLSTAFTPGSHVRLDAPKEQEVVWIVGSFKLPQPTKQSSS